MNDPQRGCPICGADLSARDPRTRACSPSHRREINRVSRLLNGETVDGYRCLRDYLDRDRRAEDACTTPEKMRGQRRRNSDATRTGRARRFVLDHVAEQPGHRTSARHAYAVYLRWCQKAEPQAPLTYAPFVAVLEGWAPHEGRDVERRPGQRGRPGTVFLGVIVRQPARVGRPERLRARNVLP
jgi:hypothetical protein